MRLVGNLTILGSFVSLSLLAYFCYDFRVRIERGETDEIIIEYDDYEYERISSSYPLIELFVTQSCYSRYYGSTEPYIKLDKNGNRIFEQEQKKADESENEDKDPES